MSDPTNEQLYDEPQASEGLAQNAYQGTQSSGVSTSLAYQGDGMSPTPALTPEDHAMTAVDAALAPVLGRLRADMGPVNTSTLIHVVNSIRQALAHVVYGAPDPVEITGESLDIAGLQK